MRKQFGLTPSGFLLVFFSTSAVCGPARAACITSVLWFRSNDSLQNSPYFCVFKYSQAVKQKVLNEAENRERDWGETRFFFLSPHMPYGRVRLASFARVRLLSHALPISLPILRKKPTILQSRAMKSREKNGAIKRSEWEGSTK